MIYDNKIAKYQNGKPKIEKSFSVRFKYNGTKLKEGTYIVMARRNDKWVLHCQNETAAYNYDEHDLIKVLECDH